MSVFILLTDEQGTAMCPEYFELASEARIYGQTEMSKEMQQRCYVSEYEDGRLVYREHLPFLIKAAKYGVVAPEDDLSKKDKPKRRMAMDGVTYQSAYAQADWLYHGKGGL